ncbi:hypothetical protein P4S72_15330 [Vibrio sp. PP-XX7]
MIFDLIRASAIGMLLIFPVEFHLPLLFFIAYILGLTSNFFSVGLNSQLASFVGQEHLGKVNVWIALSVFYRDGDRQFDCWRCHCFMGSCFSLFTECRDLLDLWFAHWHDFSVKTSEHNRAFKTGFSKRICPIY